MDRIFKFIDPITSVALLATVVGIVLCLFFLFAPTTFGKNLPGIVAYGSVDNQVSMRWIQPILATIVKTPWSNSSMEITLAIESRKSVRRSWGI